MGVLAWPIGLGEVALVTVVFTWLLPDVPPEVSAPLLLVTITVAGVLSSWRVGSPIAVLAAFMHGFVILPPVGERTVHVKVSVARRGPDTDCRYAA